MKAEYYAPSGAIGVERPTQPHIQHDSGSALRRDLRLLDALCIRSFYVLDATGVRCSGGGCRGVIAKTNHIRSAGFVAVLGFVVGCAAIYMGWVAYCSHGAAMSILRP